MPDVKQTVEQTVLDAAESQGDGDNTVTLGTGVVVRVKPISHDTMVSILARFKEPPVPMYYDPERGREIENPDDPDYIEARTRYNIDIAQAMTIAIYALGVELVEVPEDFPGPDDADWLEERRLAGLSSGDSRRARLMDWLRHKATIGGDNGKIMYAAGRATGTMEGDAAAAMKRTTGDAKRRIDPRATGKHRD